MEIIFTTCTYNHISRALSLGTTLKEHASKYRFVICVVDHLIEAFPVQNGVEMIEAKSLDIPFLDEMVLKYTALELNSALKPFLAYSILNKYQPDKVIYLDSDIMVFDTFDYLDEVLTTNSVVLSPHSLSTFSGDKGIDDRKFMRSGIFNAGFFLVKNDEKGLSFLDWWRSNLKDKCYIDSAKGMFAEQLWLNLAPLYFDFVYIDRNLGANVAYWNLHERKISHDGNRFLVNGTIPLVFYHFSGASENAIAMNSISTHQSEYDFSNRAELRPLFEQYTALLKQFGHGSNEAYYTISKNLKTKNKIIIFAVTNYKKILKRLFFSR